jgi:hypothetical protein
MKVYTGGFLFKCAKDIQGSLKLNNNDGHFA